MADRIRVQQGDLYQIENERCRIFAVKSDLIGVIGIDKLFIEKYDPTDFSLNTST